MHLIQLLTPTYFNKTKNIKRNYVYKTFKNKIIKKKGINI